MFGPDGMLYIALGDGGSGGDPQGNGQQPRHAAWPRSCGSTSTCPAADAGRTRSRPTTRSSATAGRQPEIWLTGLRNPWRMRFDRATGDLWIGDVGQGAWEEIDVARAGDERPELRLERDGRLPLLPARSPAATRPGLTLPVAEYGHDLGCAVIGGVVVARPPSQVARRRVPLRRRLLGQPVGDRSGR